MWLPTNSGGRINRQFNVAGEQGRDGMPASEENLLVSVRAPVGVKSSANMPSPAQIDWRKPNNLLAEVLQISGERVRQMRVEQNAPTPLFANLALKHARHRWAILEKQQAIRGLQPKSASAVLGFDLSTNKSAARFARQHGMVVQKRKSQHPWSFLNWKLPDSDLGRIWNIKPKVVSVARAKQRRGRAEWLPHKNAHKSDQLYLKAMAEEQTKVVGVVGSRYD